MALARRRRPIGPLDLRAQAILRAVIEEYVTTATPVGSQALVERYGLGVSSATVRNILAELETSGLLTHPHTSAGRDPDRRRLPLLRRVDRRRRAAAAGRAADDPPPVRPGRVRQRALVPPRGDDPRRGHPLGRPRHAGQAARRPHPPDRPRRDQRADGEPDPRPARGLDQAGARHARRRRRHRPADPQPGRRAPQRAPGRPDRDRPSRIPAGQPARRPARRGARQRVGERIVRIVTRVRRRRRSRRSSATACSTSWPRPSSPRATSSAASSPPSRTGPTSASSSAASPAPAGSRSSSAREPAARDAATSRSCSRPYGRPGRAIGVVGVLGPTRMSYSAGDRHGPLRVRPDERAGGSPVCLNDARTRAQERADAIDISPTALLAQIEALQRSSTRRARRPRSTWPRCSASAPSSRTSSAGPPRSASATSASPARTCIRKVLAARRRLRPRHRGAPGVDRRATPGSRASPPSTASCGRSSRARA